MSKWFNDANCWQLPVRTASPGGDGKNRGVFCTNIISKQVIVLFELSVYQHIYSCTLPVWIIVQKFFINSMQSLLFERPTFAWCIIETFCQRKNYEIFIKKTYNTISFDNLNVKYDGWAGNLLSFVYVSYALYLCMPFIPLHLSITSCIFCILINSLKHIFTRSRCWNCEVFI